LLAVWTLVGFSLGGIVYSAAVAANRSETVWAVFASSFWRVYVWGALSPLVYLFAKRFVINPRRLSFRPVAYNLLFGLFLSLIYPSLLIAKAWLTTPDLFSTFPSFWNFFLGQVIVIAWYAFISFYLPTFLTIQVLLFYRNYKDEEAKNASLQAELSRAQLGALKMQLHPHFLFNSLHSISSLILIDPKRANEMVALLGNFLRQTLEHSNDQIVTLSDELEFVKCYLEIEKTRFEDRLSVHYDIDPKTLNAEVPHLIVQPVVENAVKHGVAPHAGFGRIEISSRMSEDGLILRVRNSASGTGRSDGSKKENKNGFGLANVASRLKSIYGDAARVRALDLKPDGFEVDLIIPLG